MLFLLNLVCQSLHLGLMQILELVLVFAVLSGKVVLDIFVFSLDEIDFVCLLLLQFLELIFAVGSLGNNKYTYDFNS